MEAYNDALSHSKFIVGVYQEDLDGLLKRAVAFENVGEKKLAEEAYELVELKKVEIARHTAIVNAIEYYLENELQVA